MDFRGAAIRTSLQIAATIVVSVILYFAACFFVAVANGVPFGEMFAELNSGVSPFSLIIVSVLGYIGVFMMNLGLCDPPDECRTQPKRRKAVLCETPKKKKKRETDIKQLLIVSKHISIE